MLEVTSLCGQIHLGKQGENNARVVCFDEELALWKNTFGEGKCELVHQRNGDSEPYPVVLDVKDNKIYWKISSVDTSMVGEGKCELHYIVNKVIVKSKTWTTTVLPSLGDAVAEAPEPQKVWVDEVLSAAQRVEDATTHQPIIGENGNWFVWDFEANEYVDTGTSAKGSDGDEIRFWKPDTEYKIGDVCVTYRGTEVFPYMQILSCSVDHISSDLEEDIEANHYWWVYASNVNSSARDGQGKLIHKTYATKEELNDIKTVLDVIMEILNGNTKNNSLLSSDGCVLKDINGLYLTIKGEV